MACTLPESSFFCFSSETKFLIPALMASDLPENPIDFFNLSRSERISSFNEIETMGIASVFIKHFINLVVKVNNFSYIY